MVEDKIIDKAKKILGVQFNEDNWKYLIKEDKKKAEEQIEKLDKFLKIKNKGNK